VLEVACGSDPLTLRHYHAGSRVIASDLSFPQAQLGSLVQCARGNAPPQSFNFVAADVFHAPFKPASFDVVVICAALHHFSDTAAALATLKKFLKPGGRLVLLREPGKVCADDATYIRELESGFNEQQFELPEYDVMFERAGLSLVYEQLDFECSYKAILAAH
jgi:ubiquinone/menaquinone biosynthesis C-methylase UbiE